MNPIAFTIYGQPYSKANRRQLVSQAVPNDEGGVTMRPRLIKSPEALCYERDALKQIPPRCRVRLACMVCVTLRIFYTSERSDLDESLVLDVLQDRWKTVTVGKTRIRELVQGGVLKNDKQIRERHVYWGIDKANPRVEIVVEPLGQPSCALLERQGENHEPEATGDSRDALRPRARARAARPEPAARGDAADRAARRTSGAP